MQSDLYAFPLSGFSPVPNPPNTPEPALVFSHNDRGFVDSHGMTLPKKDRYLWVADRAANRIIVVNTGLGVVRVKGAGERGKLVAILPITNIVAGVERADPHGIAVRVK